LGINEVRSVIHDEPRRVVLPACLHRGEANLADASLGVRKSVQPITDADLTAYLIITAYLGHGLYRNELSITMQASIQK